MESPQEGHVSVLVILQVFGIPQAHVAELTESDLIRLARYIQEEAFPVLARILDCSTGPCDCYFCR